MKHIYKITNLINNKIYIGQHNGKRPWYFGSGKLLKYALDKYGRENFKKDILEEGEFTQEEIDEFHQARNYRILCIYKEETLDKYEKIFSDNKLKIIRGGQNKTEQNIIGHWVLIGSAQNHQKLTQYLLNDTEIKELSF